MQERKVLDLQRQIKEFAKLLPSGDAEEGSAEVLGLRTENDKLKYQLTHLRRVSRAGDL